MVRDSLNRGRDTGGQHYAHVRRREQPVEFASLMGFKMRKLIAYEFLSINSCFSGPEGHEMDFVTDTMDAANGADIARQYGEVDAFVMGRTTYDSLAGYWPTRTTAEEPLAAYMNSIEKLVCASSADTSKWNNSRLLEGDISSAIAELKGRSGKDMMIIGSRTVVRSLVESDLVDEFRFLVFPVVLSDGKRLFDGLSQQQSLRRKRVQPFDNGVIAIDYEIVRSSQPGEEMKGT